MSAGRHPSTSPAGLGRVPLLHSWRHTRGVPESAGRGFALTQHAHIVIIAVLYTRTTVALALPQAPSHTNVPHLSKGPPQPVPALRALPKGVVFPSSAVASPRTSGTPIRTPADRVSQALSAGAYACRPLSFCPCQQRPLQSPKPHDIKSYTRFLSPNHIIRAA